MVMGEGARRSERIGNKRAENTGNQRSEIESLCIQFFDGIFSNVTTILCGANVEPIHTYIYTHEQKRIRNTKIVRFVEDSLSYTLCITSFS